MSTEPAAEPPGSETETVATEIREAPATCPACGTYLQADTSGWPDTCPSTTCGRAVHPEEVLGL